MNTRRKQRYEYVYRSHPQTRVLGLVLRKIRHEKSLSQHDVAQAANVNNSYYCMIENGMANPSVLKLLSICDGLGTRPDYVMQRLLYFSDEKDQYIDL